MTATFAMDTRIIHYIYLVSKYYHYERSESFLFWMYVVEIPGDSTEPELTFRFLWALYLSNY